MSEKDLNYCTYCEGSISLNETMSVTINTTLEVDGIDLGFLNDNYSLCSYECLYRLIDEETDLHNPRGKTKYFREQLEKRELYRTNPINEGDKE